MPSGPGGETDELRGCAGALGPGWSHQTRAPSGAGGRGSTTIYCVPTVCLALHGHLNVFPYSVFKCSYSHSNEK